MCYSKTNKLWESVKKMYSDLKNKSRISELALKGKEIQQRSDSVPKYFHYLKLVWQDLDWFNTYKWKSTENAKHHQQTVEEGIILQSLTQWGSRWSSYKDYWEKCLLKLEGRKPVWWWERKNLI